MVVTLARPVLFEGSRSITESEDWRVLNFRDVTAAGGSEDILTLKDMGIFDNMGETISVFQNQGYEIKSIIPVMGSIVGMDSRGGKAGGGLTTTFIVTAQKNNFHFFKGSFKFENDRLRFPSSDLDVFKFFKNNMIKVNLACKNNEKKSINILSNKKIDNQNTEITNLEDIKQILQAGNITDVEYKILSHSEELYTVLLDI